MPEGAKPRQGCRSRAAPWSPIAMGETPLAGPTKNRSHVWEWAFVRSVGFSFAVCILRSDSTRPEQALPRMVCFTRWIKPVEFYRFPFKTGPRRGTLFERTGLGWPFAGEPLGSAPDCRRSTFSIRRRTQGHRKIAPRNLARGVTTFRLLQLPTPGTTQVPTQPLGAERRGGRAGATPQFQG